jgi:hypothetical protein
MWDEYVGGIYCGSETDDCGVRGNPPNFTQMQAGQAEEGSSTAPLVVGATDGLGRQQDNWLRRVMAQSKSHPAMWQRGSTRTIGLGTPHALLPLFLVESTSVWVQRRHCVCLSLVLILVVKILGGGGMSSGLGQALVLETTPPRQKTS